MGVRSHGGQGVLHTCMQAAVACICSAGAHSVCIFKIPIIANVQIETQTMNNRAVLFIVPIESFTCATATCRFSVTLATTASA